MTGTAGLAAPDAVGGEVSICAPTPSDGAQMWRLARDAGNLDVNSSYSYLLWCRDFAGTSVVARDGDGRLLGFVSGYVRPEHPATLVVWQVAVRAGQRGRGLASRMLDTLLQQPAARCADYTETTITPGNAASERLFAAFAERHGAPMSRGVLFEAALFPDDHDPEVLHRIGPFPPKLSQEDPGGDHRRGD